MTTTTLALIGQDLATEGLKCLQISRFSSWNWKNAGVEVDVEVSPSASHGRSERPTRPCGSPLRRGESIHWRLRPILRLQMHHLVGIVQSSQSQHTMSWCIAMLIFLSIYV